jgi:2-dehydro-3-deoxyphosphogluconate aldolase/(4S)-4-hydroxy-2-oxoglutarate aldolase
MKDVYETIYRNGVIPVIKLENAADAETIGRILLKCGFDVAEITFRTAAVCDGIQRLSDNFPEMLVGAGTVINEKQVDFAHKAGARFIVSPGFSAGVVQRSLELSMPVFPGCVTPSEIITAMSFGINIVKFFPSENLGGIKTIKALSAALPQIKFMPTGGVNTSNLKEYLLFNKVIACGGSWMIASNREETTHFCMEARKVVDEVRKNQSFNSF